MQRDSVVFGLLLDELETSAAVSVAVEAFDAAGGRVLP
jgi:hypothetical protein